MVGNVVILDFNFRMLIGGFHPHGVITCTKVIKIHSVCYMNRYQYIHY